MSNVSSSLEYIWILQVNDICWTASIPKSQMHHLHLNIFQFCMSQIFVAVYIPKCPMYHLHWNIFQFCKSQIFVGLPVFLNVQCIIFARISWHWLLQVLQLTFHHLPFHIPKHVRAVIFFGKMVNGRDLSHSVITFKTLHWGVYRI